MLLSFRSKLYIVRNVKEMFLVIDTSFWMNCRNNSDGVTRPKVLRLLLGIHLRMNSNPISFPEDSHVCVSVSHRTLKGGSETSKYGGSGTAGGSGGCDPSGRIEMGRKFNILGRFVPFSLFSGIVYFFGCSTLIKSSHVLTYPLRSRY